MCNVEQIMRSQHMTSYPKRTRLHNLFRAGQTLSSLSESSYGNFIIENLENSFNIIMQIPAEKTDIFMDYVKYLLENRIVPVVGPETQGMSIWNWIASIYY